MKKALGLLFISTSMFSMQLAHRIQAPRFIKHSVAIVNTVAKDIAEVAPITRNKSIEFNTPKFKIDSASFRAPHYMADTQLYHGKKGFVVVQDGEKQIIEKVLMDKTAREITKKNLKPFLKSGFLVLNQTGDGKFTLKAHHRLPGGGPVLGTIMYWLTKSACYAVALTGVTTIAVTTGGTTVLLATGAASGGAGLAVAGTIATKTAIATTAGVITGGSTVAGAVGGTAAVTAAGLANAGVGAVAAKATVATVASVGSIGGTVAAVEAASVAVGTFFGMLPTP